MRKVTGWIATMGLVIGLGIVTGCESPSQKNTVSKLQTEVKNLDEQNYKSTATMTVQMEGNSQTYYIETWYESPNVYKIALGDANKHINQIIVKNQNGMFIVSPALQKVFRFNGNWAQNQGHIYLYDQILNQIINNKDVSMNKADGNYQFTMPITPANDVVVTQKVSIDTSLQPKQVLLLDKDNKTVVKIDFQTFTKNVKMDSTMFDPQKMLTGAAQTTSAPIDSNFGYVEPATAETLGDQLSTFNSGDTDSTLLRYTGSHPFTLQEWRPVGGVDGFPQAQLVDLYGVPALYSGSDSHRLIWLNNGVEFSLASREMSFDQMKEVALSTMGQVGK